MTERTWENTYELTDEQLEQLEAAEKALDTENEILELVENSTIELIEGYLG